MWDIQTSTISLNEQNCLGFTDANDNFYSAEKIPIYGVLDFGFINANATQTISLADNGIIVPVLLDSIACTAPGTTGDQVDIDLIQDGRVIANQIFKNNQMPFDHPAIILTPDLSIRVKPRYSSAVYMYVKPVHILFRATPN